MPLEERQRGWRALMDNVEAEDVKWWLSFVDHRTPDGDETRITTVVGHGNKRRKGSASASEVWIEIGSDREWAQCRLAGCGAATGNFYQDQTFTRGAHNGLIWIGSRYSRRAESRPNEGQLTNSRPPIPERPQRPKFR